MLTTNEKIMNFLVSHQVYLMRLASGHVKASNTLLLENSERYFDRIIASLSRINGFDVRSIRILDDLSKFLTIARLRDFKKIEGYLLKNLRALAVKEPEILSKILQSSLYVQPPEFAETKESNYEELVNFIPAEGKFLNEWLVAIALGEVNRIMSQIKIGITNRTPHKEIINNIKGSPNLGFANGTMGLTATYLEGVIKTQVNLTAVQARNLFTELNKDLISKELFVATLDSRTTAVCRGNDGKIFPLGKGAIPPLHFRCRSLRVPLITASAVGNRPFKKSTEKMLEKEYQSSDKSLSVSDFNRQRVRELTGNVPASTSYNEWLKSQPIEFIEEVLGKAKSKLFLKGDLNLDSFINRKGDELTLKELVKLHEDAFIKAGLDASKYK